ncbi:MAG: ATP-binding protein [Gemmatimonadetes bacterium]|nr:ATP-binding protein [Gemmatimonadota bacterium]MDE0644040.1 ATP-binding protein [bacterium]
MAYFAQLLTQRAYALRLPRKYSDKVQQYVTQHQLGVGVERAPFRRQLDFWAFSIATALAYDLAPLEKPSSQWGKKFVDTKSVTMPDPLCDMLAIAAFYHLGYDHLKIDDPAQMIEVNNQLAGAGCPRVFKYLENPDLRLTPLDKALNLAASMVADCVDAIKGDSEHRSEPPPLSEYLPTVSNLLCSMENQRVEFKKSARASIDNDAPEKVINEGVVKTVSAFLNTNGGTLGIGITDEGEVFGLQPDLDHKKQDLDSYQNWLTTLLMNNIGAGVVGAYVGLRTERVGSEMVCLVDVAPSPSPVYAKTTKGANCFYVRVNNTTRMLEGPHIVTYVKGHWKES